jgi:peptidyl-prolyl cis-trans isomerase B (cyclophilin B)
MLRRRLPYAAMRRLILLTAALLALAIAGCGGGDGGDSGSPGTDTTAPAASTPTEQSSTPAGGDCEPADDPPAKPDGGQKEPAKKLDASKTYRLEVVTNCGSFTIELDPKQSPNATASLVALAGKRFFDGTKFHRIVPGFVIQGGDPTGSGMGGPGYTTVDTPPADAAYTKGVVAMAKTQTEPPGAAGSQFYVVTGDDAGLPPDYAIVGKVIAGQDVVDRIGALGDASEQPTQPVVIKTVRLLADGSSGLD